MAYRIPAATIEHIHDALIGIFLPYDQPVDAAEHRDVGLIDSAINRPFQTFGGEDVYPTIPRKAASLFHSLACNHCFLNGNKRTAVMALDIFLFMNRHVLLLTSRQVYEMAIQTVEANSKGIPLDRLMDDLTEKISGSAFSVDEITKDEDFFARFNDHQKNRLLNHIIRTLRFILSIVRAHSPERAPDLEELEAELMKIATNATG